MSLHHVWLCILHQLAFKTVLHTVRHVALRALVIFTISIHLLVSLSLRM